MGRKRAMDDESSSFPADHFVSGSLADAVASVADIVDIIQPLVFAEYESLPLQSSPPAPPEDNGPTPRYCRIPCPEDLTEEELKSQSEKREELKNKSYSEWDLKDLLSFRCQEYRRNMISEAEGLKEMEVTRNYYKQLEESEGFDIDFEPKYGVPPGSGHIYPLRCPARLLETKYKRLANLAIKSYNEDHKTRKFEVLEVLKVNTTETMNPFYYITFTANDVLSRYRCKTFQALVCVPLVYNGYKKVNGKPVIMCCRLKPRN